MILRSTVFAVVAVLSVADTAFAQRGMVARRRSEATLERIGSYFVEAKLPAIDDRDKNIERLAAVSLVVDAKDKHQLSFLYLFDSSVADPKREAFDRGVFGNEEVGVALRYFRCGRIDIAGDADARTKYGKRLPLFFAFDEKGKCVGEASLVGYKATPSPVMDLLGKAAGGFVRPSLDSFVKAYRDVVRDFESLEGKRRTLQDRLTRADGKKKAELDRESEQIDAEEAKVAAAEKQLLEKANVPARDAGGQRIGDPQGQGRR